MSSASLDLSLNPINKRDVPFGDPMVGKDDTAMLLVSVEGTKTLLGIGDTTNGELGAVNTNLVNMTSLANNNPGFGSFQSKISIIAGGENMFGFVYVNEAIVVEDEVYTWGKNDIYQLGFGGRDEDTCSNLISRQAGPGRVNISGVAFAGADRIRTLQMGYDHSHIITKSNRLFSWGNNYYGQLGISRGVTDWSLLSGEEPSEIDLSIGTDTIYSVYGGKDFSVLLTNQGNVYAYGRNNYNQLGISDGGVTDFCDSPVLISITNVQHIAVGHSFAVALKTDGTVWGWGDDTYGQISVTSSSGTPRSVDTPKRISDIDNAVYLTAGKNHFTILQSTGAVRVIGDNQYYQSSDPTITNIVLTYAIGNNTFYVEPDGDVWGYGAGVNNSSGLLGNDTNTATLTNQVSMLDIQSGVNINIDIRTIYGPVLILAYNLTPVAEELLLIKFDEDQILASSEYMEQKKAICLVRDIERTKKATASNAAACSSAAASSKPVVRFRSLKEQLAYEKGMYILDKNCLILN